LFLSGKGGEAIFIRGDVAARHSNFFQDLALLAQNPVLSPQSPQLLLLVGGQAIAAFPLVQISLFEPEPERLAGHAQLAGNLGVRPPARARQADRLGAELRRIGWLAPRHGCTSFGGFTPKRTGVHQTGSTPARGGGGPAPATARGSPAQRPASERPALGVG